jgi:hypothetical protein
MNTNQYMGIYMDNSKDNEEFDITKYPYLFKVPSRRFPPNVDPVGPIVYKEINLEKNDTRNND